MNSKIVDLADALRVVEELQQEEPKIYFLDGHELTGKEAWDKCLKTVLERLKSKSDEAAKKVEVIKKLPWMCGDCGQEAVQNLRRYKDGPSHIATCDNCGARWVS